MRMKNKRFFADPARHRQNIASSSRLEALLKSLSNRVCWYHISNNDLYYALTNLLESMNFMSSEFAVNSLVSATLLHFFL